MCMYLYMCTHVFSLVYSCLKPQEILTPDSPLKLWVREFGVVFSKRYGSTAEANSLLSKPLWRMRGQVVCGD